MGIERRITRPFKVSKKLERALSSIKLFTGKESYEPGSSIAINEANQGDGDWEIEWAKNSKSFDEFKDALLNGAAESGVHESRLSLIVLAKASYMRVSETHLDLSLSSISELPQRTKLDKEAKSLSLSSSDFFVFVSLVLNATPNTPKPLQPNRLGTWLARVRYKFSAKGARQLFLTKPLDDENRKRLKLESNAVHHLDLEIYPKEVTDPLDDNNLPIVWINETLFEELARSPDSPISQLIETQIFIRTAYDVLVEYCSMPKEGIPEYAEAEKSLIVEILKLAERGSPVQVSDADTEDNYILMHDEPHKFIDWIQRTTKDSSYMNNAMKKIEIIS